MSQVSGCTPLRSVIQLRYTVTATLLTFLIFVLYLRGSDSTFVDFGSVSKRPYLPRNAAANSTLGFEKLVVLSTGPSWRTHGLDAAARLTGLEFTIPVQPKNPDDLILNFEKLGSDIGATTPAHGSATAWFAHLDLLKFVIASGFSTALIVEDDVDWDVDLKQQMQSVADNVRAFTNTPDAVSAPYGTDWDVLWLGHCGSAIDEGKVRTLAYPDDTRCKTELYSGWSKHFLRDHLPDGERFIQTSTLTVCTFAYAVTAESAPKVLKLLGRGAAEAYDIAMSQACRDGELRCVIVNPQVMNHYEPPSDLGYLSPVHEGDGQGTSRDDAVFEAHKGKTGNIMKSARCEALFNDVCVRPPSEM